MRLVLGHRQKTTSAAAFKMDVPVYIGFSIMLLDKGLHVTLEAVNIDDNGS